MKKIIGNLISSKNIKRAISFLKEKKKLIIFALIIIIGIDIFFVLESSDFVIFGVLLLYGVFAKMFHMKSKVTFLLCLGLLFCMYINFLLTGTSVATEKAAVWLVLFMAMGIFQQWREFSFEEKGNNQSNFLNKFKNFPLFISMKISSIIYLIFGPTISFKLAMSPLGKGMLQIMIGKKTFITTKAKYNFLIHMNTYEYFMSGYFFMGETNPYETWVLRKMLRKDGVFFDIGAHIGWYSLNAAQIVGQKGKVVAFEPNPNCLLYLQKNKQLNKFGNITIEPIAITSNNTRLDFWIGDDMGGSLIRENTMRLTVDKNVKKIVVSAETLDDYCKKHSIKKIDLIKIDVEGAEMQVLRGAKVTLNNLSPDIIAESIDETLRADNSNRKELFSFLKSYGYFAYVFTSVGLKPYTLDQSQPTINVYFSKRDF